MQGHMAVLRMQQAWQGGWLHEGLGKDECRNDMRANFRGAECRVRAPVLVGDMIEGDGYELCPHLHVWLAPSPEAGCSQHYTAQR
jgi:hypothetical protein